MAHWDHQTVKKLLGSRVRIWIQNFWLNVQNFSHCDIFQFWRVLTDKHWNKSLLGIDHFQYGQRLDWKCTVEADFYFIPDRETHCHFLIRWNEEKCHDFIIFFCLEVWCTRAHVIVLLSYERYLFALSYLEACNPVLKLSVLQGQLLGPTCL